MAYPDDGALSNPWVDGEGLNSTKMYARITALLDALRPRTLDTGWDSTGSQVAATAAATISSSAVRRVGLIVSLRVRFTLSSTLTLPTNGDIGNLNVAAIMDASLIPTTTQVLGGYSVSGPATQGYIDSSGLVYLTAMSPNASSSSSTTIASGTTLGLGGTYLLG